MKRVILLVITNLAVMVTLAVVAEALCALMGTSLSEVLGPQYATLAVWAIVYGFAGSIISLLLSKTMAKTSCRAETIDGSEGPSERWLVETVRDLAARADLKMPEVAIYPGEANAFATGAFRNHALVAVSTEIMGKMSKEELRAVLGHEMSHVANGDMVTLSLVQGVLNSCVIFFSHVLASVLAGMFGRGNGRRRGNSGSYLIARLIQMPLGILASLVVCGYSRRREFAADAGSAKLLGSPFPMISALRRLGGLKPGDLPDSLKAFGVSARPKSSLFATHPPLEERIAALQEWHAD